MEIHQLPLWTGALFTELTARHKCSLSHCSLLLIDGNKLLRKVPFMAKGLILAPEIQAIDWVQLQREHTQVTHTHTHYIHMCTHTHTHIRAPTTTHTPIPHTKHVHTHTLFLKQIRGIYLAPANIVCAISGIPVNVFSTIRAKIL